MLFFVFTNELPSVDYKRLVCVQVSCATVDEMHPTFTVSQLWNRKSVNIKNNIEHLRGDRVWLSHVLHY